MEAAAARSWLANSGDASAKPAPRGHGADFALGGTLAMRPRRRQMIFLYGSAGNRGSHAVAKRLSCVLAGANRPYVNRTIFPVSRTRYSSHLQDFSSSFTRAQPLTLRSANRRQLAGHFCFLREVRW